MPREHRTAQRMLKHSETQPPGFGSHCQRCPLSLVSVPVDPSQSPSHGPSPSQFVNTNAGSRDRAAVTTLLAALGTAARKDRDLDGWNSAKADQGGSQCAANMP